MANEITFRSLCAQLAAYLQGRKDNECGWPDEDPEQDLLDLVKVKLAEPEDEPVAFLCYGEEAFDGENWQSDPVKPIPLYRK
jgi:hypothetical protein